MPTLYKDRSPLYQLQGQFQWRIPHLYLLPNLDGSWQLVGNWLEHVTYADIFLLQIDARRFIMPGRWWKINTVNIFLTAYWLLWLTDIDIHLVASSMSEGGSLRCSKNETQTGRPSSRLTLCIKMMARGCTMHSSRKWSAETLSPSCTKTCTWWQTSPKPASKNNRVGCNDMHKLF